MERFIIMKKVVFLVGRKGHETRREAFAADEMNYSHRVGQKWVTVGSM